VTKQKKFLQWLKQQTITDTDSASPSPKKKTLDPIKVAKKHSKWIVTAQAYTLAVNQVLKKEAGKRASAVKQLIVDLKPPKFCLPNLAVDNFLDGTFTTWNVASGNVIKSCDGSEKLGFLECCICEKQYKWPSQERVIKHILSNEHHQCCKRKKQAKSTAQSKQMMIEASKSVLGIYFSLLLQFSSPVYILFSL